MAPNPYLTAGVLVSFLISMFALKPTQVNAR